MFQIAYLELLRLKFGIVYYLDFNKENNKTLSQVFDLDLHPINTLPRIFVKSFHKLNPSTRYIDFNSCFKEYILTKSIDNTFLKGYFQNGTLLEENKIQLVKFFKISKSIQDKYANSYLNLFNRRKKIVLHRRLGDYKTTVFKEINSNALIKTDWYYEILNKIENLKDFELLIISDNILEVQIKKEFSEFMPIYIQESPELDFMLMLNADILIISNSSFAWWAGFLNNKSNKMVYAPKNWVGVNAGIEYPIGIMINEFKWV